MRCAAAAAAVQAGQRDRMKQPLAGRSVVQLRSVQRVAFRFRSHIACSIISGSGLSGVAGELATVPQTAHGRTKTSSLSSVREGTLPELGANMGTRLGGRDAVPKKCARAVWLLLVRLNLSELGVFPLLERPLLSGLCSGGEPRETGAFSLLCPHGSHSASRVRSRRRLESRKKKVSKSRSISSCERAAVLSPPTTAARAAPVGLVSSRSALLGVLSWWRWGVTLAC